MRPIPFEDVASALATVVQNRLIRGEDVRVEGLGTFKVEHHDSEIREQPDGQIVMHPPRDLVAFTPEN